MANKFPPSKTELIKQALDNKRVLDCTLFQEEQPAPYWRLSSLISLYPYCFNISHPMSIEREKQLRNNILNTVPEFLTLEPQPIHVLNTKETYNLFIPDKNIIKTIKNGPDQRYSRIACEHLFSTTPGMEREQAYFMHPNKTSEELEIVASDLKLERARNEIALSCKMLSAIINRSRGANRQSFSDIYSTFWSVLYCCQNMDVLRTRFNIKTSPIDYMNSEMLTFTNNVLRKIIDCFYNKFNGVTIDEINECVRTKAAIARSYLARYLYKPEELLTETSSYNKMAQIRRARTNFYKTYYPISLQKR